MTTLPGGLKVGSGLVHESVARRLVHLLKYQGLGVAGAILATPMAPYLAGQATALVPVPRATLRRIRYGVDPAVFLADHLGKRLGIPVLHALRPQLWWARHAGSGRRRRQPAFRLVRLPPPGSVLVDDVLTTGATLQAAAATTGVALAVTATRAGRRRSR